MEFLQGKDKAPRTEAVYLSGDKFACGVCAFTYKIDDGRGKTTLKGFSRSGFLRFLTDNGFFKRYIADTKTPIFIREVDGVIFEVATVQIKDFAGSYFKSIEEETITYKITAKSVPLTAEVTANNLREMFDSQCHLFFNPTFLERLETHTKPIVSDSASMTYKFFQNTAVRITADKIETFPYADFQGFCIWQSQIAARNFELAQAAGGGHFDLFLQNVSNGEEDRYAAFRSACGYLLNSYNSPTRGQAVICYDECISDLISPSGGTGKGLFVKAIKQLSDVCFVDGKKFDAGDKFGFQRVTEATQVIAIEDISAKTSFERFHSLLTEGIIIEQKYKDEIHISPDKSPKLLITSNSILASEGTTNQRRQFILEFSEHYSKKIRENPHAEPIRDEHGVMFFTSDFDADEWRRFDNFMLNCCRDFLKNGLQGYTQKNVRPNRLRQKTGEDFSTWILEKQLEIGVEYSANDLFKEYKDAFMSDDEKYKLGSFTRALRNYASIYGLRYDSKTSNNRTFFSVRK